MERLKAILARTRIALTPSAAAWRLGTLMVLGCWLVLLIMVSWKILLADFSVWKLIGFGVMYAVVCLAALFAYFIGNILIKLPRKFVLAIIASAPLFVMLVDEFGPIAGIVVGVGGFLTLALIAGSVGTLIADSLKLKQQKATLFALTIGMAGLIGIVYLSFVRYEEPNPAFNAYQLQDQTLPLADPSLPGEFKVQYTTYGSGNDRHRPEFGAQVGFVSQTVDGSRLIDNWESAIGWSRTGFWGFDTTKLPVQARVWYPAGTGRHPLVLIVHGNKSMEAFSDPGYEYLGRLLASRGYIAASVDQNFLNSSVGDYINPIAGGLEEENDARGWMLLKHLQQWRKWNQTSGHEFANRVDMENISLIGHSRGGEAVAVASHFNQLSHYPDDGLVEFDFGFAIKGIVAVAPVDGQYEPRGFKTPMENTNYFVIHGSTDGDVTSFAGIRQFNRAELTSPEQFKAALYVLGANHGQFNSSWGNSDTSLGWSLRKSSIMPGQAQRKIVEVYVSAFLDITHRQQTGYLPVFQDARFAAGWLPKTFYINNFQQRDTHWLATFEEDSNLSTATANNLTIGIRKLSKWREVWQNLKRGVLDSNVVALAWDDRYQSDGELVLEWEQAIDLGNYSNLIFTAAQNTDSSLPDGFKPKVSAEAADEEDFLLLDWSIVLEDSDGNSASILLSQVQKLYPQINGNVGTAQYGNDGAQSEAIMRYYSFPLDEFVSKDSDFNKNQIKTLRFKFDQSAKGSILLDDIGLL